MSDLVVLGRKDDQAVTVQNEEVSVTGPVKSKVPEYELLENGFMEANRLVDDIVLKKYLHRLTDFEIVPLDDYFKKIGVMTKKAILHVKTSSLLIQHISDLSALAHARNRFLFYSFICCLKTYKSTIPANPIRLPPPHRTNA